MTTDSSPRFASLLASLLQNCGPWLFGAKLDLALFGGSAVLALGLVALGHFTGLSAEPFPEWGWLVFVLGVDVAHVYSTLFRTYLDASELAKHPLRYTLIPLLAYAAGVALYRFGPLMFWRCLAYVAVFHFVRQQAGWVAVYRARAKQSAVKHDGVVAAGRENARMEWPSRLLDEVAIYSSTLFPVVFWHSRVEDRQFFWFVQGDFVDVSRLATAALPFFEIAWVSSLSLFVLREVYRALSQRRVELGKLVVVMTTAASWYVGIVVTNSDFDFTVTNVIVHGVPYVGLLWVYGRARSREAPETLGSRTVRFGVPAFLGLLVVLAFVEELGWDRWVFHDREWLFGAGTELRERALAFVVPLLAVPQVTHYVLDGFLWRRSDTRARPAQRDALGFASKLDVSAQAG